MLVPDSPPESNIVFVKQVKDYTKKSGSSAATFGIRFTYFLRNCYTMGCPPVRGDNPRALALARGLSNVQATNMV